ncbi:MAG: cation-translocating P-type ATPase [Acidimicrobiia bacterium]
MRLPTSINPLAPVRSLRGWLGNAEGRSSRRSTVVDNRAHIEVRGIHRPERERMRRAVKAELQRLEGVQWAEVDAVVGRAVVLFDPGTIELDDLISTVEDVEDAHDAAAERFPHDQPDHPADVEPVQRYVFALAADLAGLGVAAAGQTLRLARIPPEVPGLVALAEGQPRVRRLLEKRIGPPATDMVVAVANAVAQSLAQGPLGLVVDAAHRSAQIAEQLSRRRAWQRREPELVEGPHSVRHPPVSISERPMPLPKGPIERYTDAAAIASLGMIGVTLAATRNPRRAADQVLIGVPKAANLGRETFAAALGVAFARRDVVVMDRSVLRRLDRASTLVIDARLLAAGHWSMDALETVAPEADETTCAAQARVLLNRADPLATRRRGAWVLAPWKPDDRAPRGSDARARRLRHGGRHALGLWRGQRLMAVVAVGEEPAPLADELVATAQRGGLEVVLAGGTDAMAERLGGIARWTASGVAAEIRAHQAVGNVVIYASGRAHAGLRAADIAIGVETPGHKAPLGADLVIRQGLGQAWLVLEGVRRARAVSTRSALLALAGAGTGGAWAMLGTPRFAAQRTMLAVNLSAFAAMTAGAFAGWGARGVAIPVPTALHPWHELDGADALELVRSRRDGLDDEERQRRRRAERSRPRREPAGLVQAAIDELANPLTPVLGVGAALSAAIGSLTDAGLVLGVVGANALVGAVQRVRTEHALQELEHDGAPSSRVLVAGVATVVPAEVVVVGDVVLLGAGDTVPGDCRLLAADALEVDESTLTGESLPVTKSAAPTPGAAVPERSSMLYAGTVVVAGEASAVVVSVGRDTEAGRSAAAAAVRPASGVERRLNRLTTVSVPITVGAGALTAGISFLYRRPTREAVAAGVSLMVAAVPEGLPALATAAQVASARRLATRNALVRNPRAIEALGRVRQVCFDKTGTLTEGKLSLVLVSDGIEAQRVGALGDSVRAVLDTARRATPAGNGDGELPHATDRAIAAAAEAEGLDDGPHWTRIQDLPFQSTRGLHAVLGRAARTRSVAVKGAPEAVIPRCSDWRRRGRTVPLDAEATRLLEDHAHDLGRRGFRVLAVATGRMPDDTALNGSEQIPSLTVLGFVALADPVRPTAAAAVQTLKGAGVHLAMITGDHPSTAEAIAAELGILDGERVLTGTEIDALGDDELDRVIGDVAVFARVTPLQKVRIVASYQRGGRPVAMTGDGVNDAAAIRLADAGIALGRRGSGAARSSADIVVVDDRIETIVDAVVEGRAMWESVRAAVAILLGGNLGEVGFTLAGTALGGSAPLNPRQLLLVNLLTDLAPALAIALRDPPDRSPETLLRAGPDASLGFALTRDIAVRAGATASGATGAWAVARLTGSATRARTVGLAALVGTQLAQTLAAGGTSPTVLGATGVSVGALVLAVQTPGVSRFFGCRPMGPVGWSIALGAATTATVASIAVPWAAERAGAAVADTAVRTASRLRVPFRITEHRGDES